MAQTAAAAPWVGRHPVYAVALVVPALVVPFGLALIVALAGA